MLLDHTGKCDSSNPGFIFDQACLDIINLYNDNVTVLGQYVECDGCQLETLVTILPKHNKSLLINTKYSMRMQYVVNNSKRCEWNQGLLEHYRYGWNLTDKTCPQLYVKDEADNAYIPILNAVICLFFFATIWYMIKSIYNCTKNTINWRRYTAWIHTELETDKLGIDLPTALSQQWTITEYLLISTVHVYYLWFTGPTNTAHICYTKDVDSSHGSMPLVIEQPPGLGKLPNRITSIDVFRGFCITMLIFNDSGGGEYWCFRHVVWNGLTAADLTLPWFLWLMGISMAVSMARKLRSAVPRRVIVLHVIWRSLLLIAFGIVINWQGMKTPLRFPGVLQRLGLCYLIVGLLEAAFAKRASFDFDSSRFGFMADILQSWPQWLVMCVLVTIHTAITFGLEVPDCGAGYLGPGGLHDGGNQANCTGGAAGYIDRMIFGEHMYMRYDMQEVYRNKLRHDPEGLLGTLTATVVVYMGVQAGKTLATFASVKSRVLCWAGWGLVTTFLGAFLCDFTKNGGLIPINKSLFSLSYILTMAGSAFLIHAMLFMLVDVTRKWGGRPFIYPGMNTLLLYVLSSCLKRTFPFAWTPTLKTHSAYLGMNLWATAVWLAISIFMYKHNIFVSL